MRNIILGAFLLTICFSLYCNAAAAEPKAPALLRVEDFDKNPVEGIKVIMRMAHKNDPDENDIKMASDLLLSSKTPIIRMETARAVRRWKKTELLKPLLEVAFNKEGSGDKKASAYSAYTIDPKKTLEYISEKLKAGNIEDLFSALDIYSAIKDEKTIPAITEIMDGSKDESLKRICERIIENIKAGSKPFEYVRLIYNIDGQIFSIVTDCMPIALKNIKDEPVIETLINERAPRVVAKIIGLNQKKSKELMEKEKVTEDYKGLVAFAIDLAADVTFRPIIKKDDAAGFDDIEKEISRWEREGFSTELDEERQRRIKEQEENEKLFGKPRDKYGLEKDEDDLDNLPRELPKNK